MPAFPLPPACPVAAPGKVPAFPAAPAPGFARVVPAAPAAPNEPPPILVIVPAAVINQPDTASSKSYRVATDIGSVLVPHALDGFRAVCLPAIVPLPSATECRVPEGIPTVPLFVKVPFTNTRKPFVNNVAPELTVRLL